MTNLHRYVRPFRTPSLHRLRIYRPTPLLIVAAASLLLSAVLTHAQDVRDSVFSRKADCTLVGPFAGSYEKGWTVEYDPDHTAWLVHAPHYRAQLQVMARGYRVGTAEYHGAAWYGRLSQDLFAVWRHRYDAIAMADQAKIAKYSKPPVPYRPSLNLAAYVGTYRNDYVGRVKIAVDNGSLLLTRGVRQAPLPLQHWDGNTFLSFPFPDTPGLPALVDFKVDAGGGPSRIQLEEFAGNGEGTDSVTRTE